MRHLRVLCAIADAGSLHRAARVLGMTQPSLSTQLRRIEQALGGALFERERSGCRPTALGRSVVVRARPLVAELSVLVAEARARAAGAGGPVLRLGSGPGPVAAGWLRRIRGRLPRTETALHVEVSANVLLAMVADGRLDVAVVPEVEGCPLRVPAGLERHVVVEREPQFVALAADHPAAAAPVVDLAALTGERWVADPGADGEREGLHRVLGAAGAVPRVLEGDALTAASLVAAGEVVALCRPTSPARPDTVIRPLRHDPLGVCLFLAVRAGGFDAALFADLGAAYGEAAGQAAEYRAWLRDVPAGPPAPPGQGRG